jgi:hypothetical protein
MLFKVQVIVVRAVRISLGASDPRALDDRGDGWCDAVMYWFGINADTASDAVAGAERAAEHARDRNGEYIGGVVAQLHVRRAHVDEFAGYDEYFLQPISRPGIFYVTGTTSFWMPTEGLPGTSEALAVLRQAVREDGLPPVSFAHPRPPAPRPPVRTRILCPTCHRWAEVDSLGVVYSQCDGLDPDSPEAKAGRQAGRTLGDFIQRHTPCLPYSHVVGFTFVHAGEAGFHLMEPSMEDDGGEI